MTTLRLMLIHTNIVNSPHQATGAAVAVAACTYPYRYEQVGRGQRRLEMRDLAAPITRGRRFTIPLGRAARADSDTVAEES